MVIDETLQRRVMLFDGDPGGSGPSDPPGSANRDFADEGSGPSDPPGSANEIVEPESQQA